LKFYGKINPNGKWKFFSPSNLELIVMSRSIGSSDEVEKFNCDIIAAIQSRFRNKKTPRSRQKCHKKLMIFLLFFIGIFYCFLADLVTSKTRENGKLRFCHGDNLQLIRDIFFYWNQVVYMMNLSVRLSSELCFSPDKH
jgi:hypothetical protein